MAKTQLRPFYTDDELTKVYDHVYDHKKWQDHIDRIDWTVTNAKKFIRLFMDRKIDVVDLTCGDGVVMNALLEAGWVEKYEMGDLVGADHLTLEGKIEDTLPLVSQKINGLRPWDLFICTETIEHVQDPEKLLAEIREASDHLLLTTPLDETVKHDNPEHYWSWSREDMRELLLEAGWQPHKYDQLNTDWYDYQMWWCS